MSGSSRIGLRGRVERVRAAGRLGRVGPPRREPGADAAGRVGVRKTALLEYLGASASDLTVLRAVGVESEMELAYAGLH
jgi:hypothetical protein